MALIDGALNVFQCSSASRKFLNPDPVYTVTYTFRFSALQRAENSSIYRNAAIERTESVSVLFSEPKIPQQFR